VAFLTSMKLASLLHAQLEQRRDEPGFAGLLTDKKQTINNCPVGLGVRSSVGVEVRSQQLRELMHRQENALDVTFSPHWLLA